MFTRATHSVAASALRLPVSSTHSLWQLLRHASSAPGADVAQPDYYALLGLERGASPEEVKASFRALAKKHHPDVLSATGTVSEESMDFFKLLNEAHGVLSDSALRRDYDSAKFSRAALLQRRSSSGGGGAASGARRGDGMFSMRHASAGMAADEAAGMLPEEAFQRALTKAHERVRDSARFRASLARVNRPKIDVPTMQESMWSGAVPYLAAAAIWIVPFAIFSLR